ncbi:MAG: CapA family protein [Bacteroidales bacterium]|nr:CapA family protein [Bacteroidales bacterium]
MRRWLVILSAFLMAGPVPGQRLPGRYVPAPLESLRPMRFELMPQQPDTVSIFIVGDIMSHQAMTRSAFRDGGADYSTFFRHLEGRIAGADLAVGNMEFPLAGVPYTGYPSFSGPDEYARYLSDIGFDILLTANNHILDKGVEGLRRTVGVLDGLEGEGRLLYTGIAANAAEDTLRYPLMVAVKGVRIALLNFTYGTNTGASTRWPKVNRLRRDEIREALGRARKADFVLAFPHWGIEYQHHHSADQEDLARFLLENGVDAVIGAHPHVVQDRQSVGGAPVLYSLGNAVSNQNDLPARLELAVTLRIVIPYEAEPYLLEPAVEYLWCTKPGMLEDSYATVPVRDFLGRKEQWRRPEDYDDMARTYEKVSNITGIYEENDPAGNHRPY